MPPSRGTLLDTTLQKSRARLHGHLFQICHPESSQTAILSQHMQQTLNDLYALLNVALTDPQAPTPSALLIGPPGSGKSLLTTRVLHLLADLQPLTVHFSGLLHATPLSAWRHLAHQLSNFYSTDTPLTSSIQDCLGTISKLLDRLRQTGRPFLIVLHQFDRFVSSSSAGMSQNVLYSLFNFMQDRTLCSACIALTAHIDVTDGLEKRVKSRFAHREIVIPLPKSVDEVLGFVRSALIPSVDSNDEEGGVEKRYGPFDKLVEELLESAECRRIISKFMFRSRVMAPILGAFDAALVAAFDTEGVKTKSGRLQVAVGVLESNLAGDDTSRGMISGLSVLEIALLVSLRKLEAFKAEHESAGCPVFRDVFRQYQRLERGDEGLISNRDGERTLGRGVAEKAWEKLVESGLVCRTGHGPKEMREVQLAIAGSLVDEAMNGHPRVSTAMKSWGRVDHS